MITASVILSAKILIVDDKESNVELLHGMLRIAGYTCVSSTTNPQEVCELHRKNHFDLILLDLQMPVMDGFEVMEGLKEIEAGGYLPVLVITAQPQHKLRALEAGVKDFVSKPFDLAELRARVQNILEVRLLHLEEKKLNKVLAEAVRELQINREVVRIKTLEERKYMERELDLAHETQKSLLPRYMPRFENYHLRAYNSPTGQVGGNFYDFLQMESRQWMGVLADVSGKGMPSALFSSLVLGALSMEFRSKTELHEILNRVNQLLCEKSLPSQFVTLFLFLLNPEGVGQFVSAGHTPTYLYRAATGQIDALESEEYMLGMFGFTKYRSRKFHLDKGDILIVYSDGLTNSENQKREQFGQERLHEIIQRDARLGSESLEQGLLKGIKDFTQGTPLVDDVTFLVVEKYQ